jgi:hypothetical protein
VSNTSEITRSGWLRSGGPPRHRSGADPAEGAAAEVPTRKKPDLHVGFSVLATTRFYWIGSMFIPIAIAFGFFSIPATLALVYFAFREAEHWRP